MRRKVTIIDLVTHGPGGKLFSRMMNANYATIMPQAIAVWCAELGHDVRYVCYTGAEDLLAEAKARPDLLILGTFTRSSLAAYAVSNLFRRHGAVTVLGGPHARCYPEDSARYFDYVLGLTDKNLVDHVISDCTANRPLGLVLEADRQPSELPGVEQRWPFVRETVSKARGIKLIPMIGSLGCPYTCSFCIDSVVDYQTLGFEQIKSDLRFLKTKIDKPIVAWHDPNFGVRFDDYMDAIEEAVEPGSVRFVAESSLSLLQEKNLRRMAKNGFVGILPGVESWFEFGNKSRATRINGMERVRQISDHVRTILGYIPFVQANFLLGLDCEEGREPFELTKQFIKRTPGVFPAFSLLTCYGRAAPVNLELQRAGRVLPVPFHFLDSNKISNVLPAHYDVVAFAELVSDLMGFVLSKKVIARRFAANKGWTIKWLNAARAATSKRYKWQRTYTTLLKTDPGFRSYFEGKNRDLPDILRAMIRERMGNLWPLLPAGALDHDPNAYLAASDQRVPAVSPKRPETASI